MPIVKVNVQGASTARPTFPFTFPFSSRAAFTECRTGLVALGPSSPRLARASASAPAFMKESRLRRNPDPGSVHYQSPVPGRYPPRGALRGS